MVDNVAAVVKERSPGNFHLEVNHNTVIFNDVFLERQVHRLFEENRSGSSGSTKTYSSLKSRAEYLSQARGKRANFMKDSAFYIAL